MKSGTLKDGLGMTITFAGDATFFLDVDPSSITPPGIDGGDAIDTTSHSNSTYRTKYPRTLVEITDASFTAAYDPDAYDDILAQLNVNQAITFTFPGTGTNTLVVYGFLKSFIPNELVEGEQATAEFEIVITNDKAGTETGPDYTT